MNTTLRDDRHSIVLGTRSRRLLGQAFWLSALALFSPVTGLVVELVIAWKFGAGESTDAYRIATLLLTLATQIFLTQLLPNLLIPLFARYEATGESEIAWSSASIIAFGTLLFATVAAVYFWCWPDRVVEFLGPGLSESSARQAATLIRWCGLAFAIQSVTGTLAGILNSFGTFYTLQALQIVTNGLVTASILTYAQRGILAVAVGILAAAVLGLAWHMHLVLRILREHQVRISLDHRAVAGAGFACRLILPLLIVFASNQWAVVVINRGLSHLQVGSVAVFGYAWKLVAMLVLIPTSIATVMFPELSRAHASADKPQLVALSTRVIVIVSLLIIAIGFWLFCCRHSLVELVLARGAMSKTATSEVALLFGTLLIGGSAGAIMGLAQRISFATNKGSHVALSSVMFAAIISITVPYSARHFGPQGVALSYNIACASAAILLLVCLGARQRLFDVRLATWYVRKGAGPVLVAMAIAVLGEQFENGVTGAVASGLYLATSGALTLVASGFVALRNPLPEVAQIRQFGRELWRNNR
jgi:putative peptidoglycan lipid II flippase